jgi:hypothetical protein
VALENGIAMEVVPGTFLRIGQNLVGSLDFGEASCCVLCVAIVSIRMLLESFLSVCFLDSMRD